MTSNADLAMPDVPGDEAGPKFDAPWQAQAFAIVVRLNKIGHFGWDEWVRVFSQEIARAPTRAEESESDTYYRQWLDALEQIVVSKGLLAAGDTEARAAEWRAAYINTPHGQAVELASATCPPLHTRVKASRGVPITVSTALPRVN